MGTSGARRQPIQPLVQPFDQRLGVGLTGFGDGLQVAAALYDPLWTSGILSLGDAMIALAGFALLVAWRVPPLAIVAGSVAASITIVMI